MTIEMERGGPDWPTQSRTPSTVGVEKTSTRPY